MLPDVARCQESEGEQNQEEIRGLKLGHSNSFFRWFFFSLVLMMLAQSISFPNKT